jgi:formate dehydrogenase
VARVLCILYDDPKEGHPLVYVRDGIPRIELYADGRITPSPAAIDFTPGELVGDVTGALGLRKFLVARGHSVTVLSDQDELASRFDQELSKAEIVISQACWPARLTAERIATAHNLRLVIIAGEGAEEIDLDAAARRGITVAEITHSSAVSTAVMLILSLVHNVIPPRIPGTRQAECIADYVQRAYDLEGMHIGILGAGQVGLAVLRRLRPFDVRLHYTDPKRLPLAVEDDLRIIHHPTAAAMVPICDVVSIHAPLGEATARLFDMNVIGRMKRGAYLVNTARGEICDPQAVNRALETGRLAGYATDTLLLRDVPVRIAGSTLSAQARYAAGVREVLDCWFDGIPVPERRGGGGSNSSSWIPVTAIQAAKPVTPDSLSQEGHMAKVALITSAATYLARLATPLQSINPARSGGGKSSRSTRVASARRDCVFIAFCSFSRARTRSAAPTRSRNNRSGRASQRNVVAPGRPCQYVVLVASWSGGIICPRTRIPPH